MRRLASGILAIVVLFVLVVAGTLIARSRTASVESVGPAPSTADLQIKEVQLNEEESGGVRWRLRAEQASVYDAEGRTSLRQIAVDVNEPNRTWTIVGEEGDIFQRTKDVELRRNVVVTSSDGLRLETGVLYWSSEQKRIWTDAPVLLSHNGSIVRGTGLDVRMASETTTVTGRVRARFENGRAR